MKKLIAQFCMWFLKSHLHSLNVETAELRASLDQSNRSLSNCHSEMSAMRRRTNILFAWYAECDEFRKRDRFGLQYIIEGQETGSSLSSTGGVHPAVRWGFNTFRAFEDNYDPYADRHQYRET